MPLKQKLSPFYYLIKLSDIKDKTMQSRDTIMHFSFILISNVISNWLTNLSSC